MLGGTTSVLLFFDLNMFSFEGNAFRVLLRSFLQIIEIYYANVINVFHI